MQRAPFAVMIVVGAFAIASAQPSLSQTIKVTPLGSHDGEFCALDRALIFEDPDGTRILYDADRTVRGPEDPRLGSINAVPQAVCRENVTVQRTTYGKPRRGDNRLPRECDRSTHELLETS